MEVADTGAGISPEDLPLIFDRFWRADKSRSRRTGGSGLGLPITRQLVEAHSGHVTATSTPQAWQRIHHLAARPVATRYAGRRARMALSIGKG